MNVKSTEKKRRWRNWGFGNFSYIINIVAVYSAYFESVIMYKNTLCSSGMLHIVGERKRQGRLHVACGQPSNLYAGTVYYPSHKIGLLRRPGWLASTRPIIRLITAALGSCELFYNVRAGWACWCHPYIESTYSLILTLQPNTLH